MKFKHLCLCALYIILQNCTQTQKASLSEKKNQNPDFIQWTILKLSKNTIYMFTLMSMTLLLLSRLKKIIFAF